MTTTTTAVTRREAGRALRSDVPRSLHAEWDVEARDRDPVTVLEEQGRTRVPELVPVRYERMAVSPFTFFRGGAAIMAMDLSTTPVTGLTVQACGDAHVANFGTFATPERNIVFDINDFDETEPRTVGVGRQAPRDQPARRRARARLPRRPARRRGARGGARVPGVRRRVRGHAHARHLVRPHDGRGRRRPLPEALPAASRPRRHPARCARTTSARSPASPPIVTAGRGSSRTRRSSCTSTSSRRPPTTSRPPSPPTESRSPTSVASSSTASGWSTSPVESWAWAASAPGVGSCCSRRWPRRRTRRTGSSSRSRRRRRRCWRPTWARRRPGTRADAWCRASGSPRRPATCSSGGARRPSGHHYYVRQLWDVKGQGDLTKMDLGKLTSYGALCARALARAHARTGDAAAIAGYLGGGGAFDHAITGFAANYAAANARDHASLVDAIASGRVVANSAANQPRIEPSRSCCAGSSSM